MGGDMTSAADDGSRPGVNSDSSASAVSPTRFARSFFRQFSRPTGLLGWVAGRAMARTNATVSRWVADLLAPAAGERILDLGCGPGVLLSLAAATVGEGRAVGVDVSQVMVAQARRRNRSAIRAGRAEVQEAVAESLPFPEAHFDAVSSVNSLQHWGDVEAGLREIARVMRPGGRLCLVLRMRVADASRLDRRSFGSTQERVGSLASRLAELGFSDVEILECDIAGERQSAIRATRTERR